MAWPNGCLCWTRTVWRGPIVASVGHELYCFAQLLPLLDTNYGVAQLLPLLDTNCVACPDCTPVVLQITCLTAVRVVAAGDN